MSTINGKVCVADGVAVDKVFSNDKQVYGRNLIVRTGEIANQMVGPDGSIIPYYTSTSTLTRAIISVTPGEQLTMSGSTDGDNILRYAFYDAAGKTLMRNYAYLNTLTTVAAPAGAATFRISYPKEAQAKLERGSVATPWTPAPEDVLKGDVTAPNNLVAK